MATEFKSQFFAKHGSAVKKVVDENRDMRPKSGGLKLPPGIPVGIARVEVCEFGVTEGREWFRITGAVESPVEFKGIPIVGVTTTQFVNLDPLQAEESLREVMEKMVSVGASFGSEGNYDLLALAKMIQAKKPKFRFSTSPRKQQVDAEGKPKIDPKTGEPYPPGVWENWHGGVPEYSQPTPSTNGTHTNGQHNPQSVLGPGDPDPWADRKSSPTPADGTTDHSDETDIELLVTLAQAPTSDKGADARLRKLCADLEYTDDDYDAAGYPEIKEWIQSGEKKGGSTEVFQPVAGETQCMYSPPAPKDTTGKTRLKPVPCVVAKINKSKSTMTLEESGNAKKQYKDIAWDDENVKYET